MKSSCLVLLAVLLGSTDALKRKEPKAVSGTEGLVLDESPSPETLVSHEKPSPDEEEDEEEEEAPPAPTPAYHRAAGVPKGECTQKLKPTLFFIGHAYSGSTSLADQMSLNPELSHGTTKEHQFFSKDLKSIESNSKFEKYLDQFWVSCNATVAYDATMDYLPMGASKESIRYFRHRMGPNVKLMAMFRDPLDIYFHLLSDRPNLVSEGNSEGDMVTPFDLHDPPNVTKRPDLVGTEYLSNWLEAYPKRSSWLFLDSDDYFASPEKVLKKIFAFSRVKNVKLDKAALNGQSGRRRSSMKASAAQRKAFWSIQDNRDDKKRLEKLTGLRFDWK